MRQASRTASSDVRTPARGRLEVSLEVPNLGHAVGFYSNIFAARPTAVERRIVWFAVPGSTSLIELRETLTPTPTRLRLCTEPHRVKRVATELSRSGVAVAQAGLTRDGSPRAISFRDPGRNHWELYTSIIASSPPADGHHSIAQSWRSLRARPGGMGSVGID